MAKQKINPKQVIREYARSLPASFIVEKIFMFGSQATGRATEDSDIDCIIVSPSFARMQPMRRLEFLSRQRRGMARQVGMDIFGFTPEEFATLSQSDSPNVRELMREGKFVRVSTIR